MTVVLAYTASNFLVYSNIKVVKVLVQEIEFKFNKKDYEIKQS